MWRTPGARGHRALAACVALAAGAPRARWRAAHTPPRLLLGLLAAAPRLVSAQLPYGVKVYPVQNFGGPLPGSPSFPASAALLGATNATALQLSTGFQCNYIEQQFTESFSSPVLNLTKWLPTGSVQPPAGVKPTTFGTTNYPTPWGPQSFGAGQSHCPAAGAVGAASPSTCTVMDPQGLFPGSALPGGGTGATMTLSQSPCYFANGTNNPYCCNSQSIIKKVGGVSVTFIVNVCASWSGAHLSSQFCAQYGVLEVEAKYNMPAEGGAYQVRMLTGCACCAQHAPTRCARRALTLRAQFFGVYMYGCRDPWGNSYNGGSPSPNCDVSWCARPVRAACAMRQAADAGAALRACVAGTRLTSWCTTTRRTGRPTAPACS